MSWERENYADFGTLDSEDAPSVDPLILRPPTQPMRFAREMVQRLYTQPAGLILRNQRGDFFQWDGTKWPELEIRDLRARTYALLEHAVYEHVDGQGVPTLKPFAPTQKKISDIIDALSAIVLVRSGDDAPCWIDERIHPPAHELIANERAAARPHTDVDRT